MGETRRVEEGPGRFVETWLPRTIATWDPRLPDDVVRLLDRAERDLRDRSAVIGLPPEFDVRVRQARRARAEAASVEPALEERIVRASLTARLGSSAGEHVRTRDLDELARIAAGEDGQRRTFISRVGALDGSAVDWVCPAPIEIDRLMRDLESFLQRDDIPVVAKAAAAYGQLVMIHPWVDGNGRVGRLLFERILRDALGGAQCTVAPVMWIMSRQVDATQIGLRLGWGADRPLDWFRIVAGGAIEACRFLDDWNSATRRLIEHDRGRSVRTRLVRRKDR
jgi:hypothetical protein